MWTKTDAVGELYLLIFLCGAGGVRQGFGKEVGKGGFHRVAGGKDIPAEGTAGANTEGCESRSVLGQVSS